MWKIARGTCDYPVSEGFKCNKPAKYGLWMKDGDKALMKYCAEHTIGKPEKQETKEEPKEEEMKGMVTSFLNDHNYLNVVAEILSDVENDMRVKKIIKNKWSEERKDLARKHLLIFCKRKLRDNAAIVLRDLHKGRKPEFTIRYSIPEVVTYLKDVKAYGN